MYRASFGQGTQIKGRTGDEVWSRAKDLGIGGTRTEFFCTKICEYQGGGLQ